jgi:Heterokaryon incompatibility protein (HET)
MAGGGLYTGKPLRGPSSIRLLKLEPGLKTDPLRCTFKVVDLRNQPEYEALSYTWGNDGKTRRILCDGFEVDITTNLEDALRHFRPRQRAGGLTFKEKIEGKIGKLSKLKEKSQGWSKVARRSAEEDPKCHRFCGYLWADAICINQDDDRERAEQVGIMRNIYTHAKSVLVWLGRCDDEKRLTSALDLIHRALQEYRKGHKKWSKGKKDGPFVVHAEVLTRENNKARGFPPFDSPDWAALLWFFSLPWFSRLWVVQEISLSRSATAFIGDYEISNPYLLGYAADWFTMKQYNRPPSPPIGEQCIGNMLNDRLRVHLNEESLRLRLLLTRTREFGVKLPVDRIYALIGIASEGNHPRLKWDIVPDYTKPYQEVYRHVARLLIGCSADLGILNDVQEPLARSHLHWSTWVPNWNEYIDAFINLSVIDEGRFNACQSKCKEMKDHSDPRFLRLKGLGVDMVKDCMSTMTAGDVLGKTIPLWQYITQHLGPVTGSYANGDSLGLAFTMTVTAGNNGFGYPAEDDLNYLSGADDFWKRTLGPLGVDVLGYRQTEGKSSFRYTRGDSKLGPVSYQEGRSGFSAFEDAILAAMSKRRLFVTFGGYIGIGPKEMKPYDQVVILYGGRTPYILRPRSYWWIGGGSRPMTREPNDGSYFLVGDCYIHGMMKGEMMEQQAREEKWYDIR